MDIYVSAIIC